MAAPRLISLTGVAAALALSLSACSPPSSGGPATGTGTNASITVFAAASLEHAFTAIAKTVEQDHPGSTVQLSFAGSASLAAQIIGGAPADVFASADERTMTTVRQAGMLRGRPTLFATNRLEIAVPPENPAGVTSLADLARTGVVTVVCAPQVPCGSATATVERVAGITIRPASEELSVTDVLGKVSSGEADAGLVYATDVRAAGGSITGIEFPESREAINDYPIAEVKDAGNRALVKAFIAAVSGERGQALLHRAGFGPRP